MSATELGPWLGRCHFIREGVRHEVLAAVLCRSHQEFDTILTDVLTAQNLELLWSEEVHPVGPWVYVRPGRGGAELAGTIHEGRRVAFGPVKTLKEAEEPPKDHLHITEITGIIPLAFEVGSWSERTVPEALEEPLFGRPEPTEVERAVYGDALLKTYAILDAAKMPYLLTGFLAGSGLRYQSLFQGKTQEDLKEHAPYLVELEQENDLTKRLFTGPKGINGLWEKELGIYIRSRMGFDEVRKHFRKFTRIQDESGKWFYFRFWEKNVFYSLEYLKSDQNKLYGFGNMIHSVLFDAKEGFMIKFITDDKEIPNVEPSKFLISIKPFLKQKKIDDEINNLAKIIDHEEPSKAAASLIFWVNIGFDNLKQLEYLSTLDRKTGYKMKELKLIRDILEQYGVSYKAYLEIKRSFNG